MKTIYLLRHAKSDWDASYVGDHERPLADRGIKAARRIGKFLSRCEQLPDIVLCSTSLRTRQTIQTAAEAGNWTDIEVQFENELYLSSQERILSRIRELDGMFNSVMIVGHEPTTSVVAGILIGAASVRFPTAGCARIDVHVEQWSKVHAGAGTLQWHVIPKVLKKKKKKSKSE